MSSATWSVSVDRPIQDVFGFLAEGTNNPMWQPGISLVARVSPTDVGLGEGARYVQRIADSSGRTVEETYVVTRFDPPRLLEYVATRGTTRTVGLFTLARIDAGTTHVELTLRRETSGLGSTFTRTDGEQLRRQAAALEHLPSAMRDECP